MLKCLNRSSWVKNPLVEPQIHCTCLSRCLVYQWLFEPLSMHIRMPIKKKLVYAMTAYAAKVLARMTAAAAATAAAQKLKNARHVWLRLLVNTCQVTSAKIEKKCKWWGPLIALARSCVYYWVRNYRACRRRRGTQRAVEQAIIVMGGGLFWAEQCEKSTKNGQSECGFCLFAYFRKHGEFCNPLW